MASGLHELLQKGQAQAFGDASVQALLTAPEAERMIEQLQPLSVEEVGSQRWHTQHEWIEKLNLQAHYNAQSHSDEFVVETLVSLDKMQVLVHDLLTIEAWKEYVFPLLSGHLAENVDPVLSYLLLFHEAAVANLLEVTLFHSHAMEALPEDHVLELADWCYRKLAYLNSDGHAHAQHKELTAAELMAQTRQEELDFKRRETEFGTAMCSLTIARYLSEYVPSTSLALVGRLVSTNDTPMALVALLERPPWVRSRGKRLEKFVDNKWQAVAPAERFKLSQPDVQTWLALNNLVVDPKCRARYNPDEYRRDRLLGLRRHLNELLFDQLPVLKDLQRALDELALNVGVSAADAKTAGLILEQVPGIRDGLRRGRNWRAIAEQQRVQFFGEAAKSMAKERMDALMKAFDFLVNMEPESVAAEGGVNGAANAGHQNGESASKVVDTTVRLECWRKVHQNVMESWSEVALTIAADKPPEPVTLGGPDGSATGSSQQQVLHGLRYRLAPMEEENTRPLPQNGKAVVKFCGHTAEALLQLPEVAHKTATDAPAALWVTVGLLATDGLALQLKLKRAEKPKERDKASGTWYAYHPVGGAITVLQDSAATP